MKAFKILAFSIFFGASLNAQVGFGTTSPSNDIDVESSSATATAVDINCTGAGDPKINFQLSGTSTFSMGIDNSDADKFKIGTSALETNTRLTIDASGNVGIGTSSPNAPLQLGNALSNRKIVLYEATNNDHQFFGFGINGGCFRFQIAETSSWYSIFAATSSTASNELMRITGTGNVGIGTSSPTANLDVDGSAIFNESGAAKNFRVESDNNTSMLYVDGTNDRVGIGTSSPSNILQVGNAGRLRISNGTNDYTLLGTQDSDGGTNTRIVLSGNVRGGFPGFVEYIATNTGAHIWYTTDAGSERMRLTSTGYLGIGTSSPNAPLQLGNALSNRKIVLYEATNNDHQFFGFGINGGCFRFQIAETSSWYSIFAATSSTSSNEIIRIQGDGKLGIGTSSPGYLLTVNGQPAANGYTAFTNYSDSRLKTNISSLDTGALSKILQLRPVSFQYNQKYLQLYPNSDLQKVHKGFIAQEIRTVFPEMVSEMKASPDSVQYLDLDVSHLQIYLVKAMQEQQAIIQEQQAIIESLKKANEEQNAKAMLQKAEMAQNAIKVAELENKMNAMLLLLNNKTELTVKQ